MGKLNFEPVDSRIELVAEPTKFAISGTKFSNVLVSEINSELSDTAAFCDYYNIGMDVSANCVVVEAKRGDQVWYAACLILANNRIDINGVVRHTLEARKVSFAPMDKAVSLTAMEYGGITPIGLPEGWPILVDSRVAENSWNIIGSGIRKSKLLVTGQLLANLPTASVLNIVKPAQA